MSTASGLLGGHAHYLHWGIVQLSIANLVVILLMLLVFLLALLLPFPASGPAEPTADRAGESVSDHDRR